MSSIRRSEGFKQREQDELINSVEDRELETQAFLQEKGNGAVDKTVLQIAGILHISERKAREYFMKEWARDNVELSTKSRQKLWKWIAPSRKFESRFNVEKMGRMLMPEEEDENATEYMRRKNKEKEDRIRNELQAKFKEKLTVEG
jgi:hypothetical protein